MKATVTGAARGIGRAIAIRLARDAQAAGGARRAAHAALRQSRGAMLVVTSISGTHATSPLGACSASKAATLILMRQLAGEWGPDGIRVNALSPGLILTPGTAAAYADPAARTARAGRIPLRRMGEPEDMAAVAAFLLGPDAAYVSGAELLADGGLAQTLMSSLPMGGWRARDATALPAA
jgi:NAD(P)-dependent dehydrogenase (short-subunit alcohol dehydrogenase family)